MVQYQICSSCVMDMSDESISFDEMGICSHCRTIGSSASQTTSVSRDDELASMIDNLKFSGRNMDYDCILGLSGGVDSSYLALRAKEWGLRPLVFHVDAGWNSELAVHNIERVCEVCDYDLHTYVVDWKIMRDLQVAYLKSGVANQDVPQDHIFFASQYHFAVNNDIRFILSGGNLASESVSPDIWNHSALDAINLHDIHRRFGDEKMANYKTISFGQYYFWYPFVRKLRVLRPLNLISYNYVEARETLKSDIDWRDYGRKHGESVFTKIFQNHILPTRFGFDKRRIHYSSLIISGQMTREEALVKLKEPLYEADDLAVDIEYFCKKLRISRDEFDGFMQMPLKYYDDYANWDSRLKLVKFVQNSIQRLTGRRITAYS